jgi:hypothetical protein
VARDDDWFRSPAWDAAAQERFETKLARSRRGSSRGQYLNFKGHAIARAGHLAAADQLAERGLAEDPGSSYMQQLYGLLRGRIARDRGDFSSAASFYRLTGDSGYLALMAALAECDTAAIEEAAQLWSEQKVHGFNHELFEYYVVAIRLCERVGDREPIAGLARTALSYVGLPSQFSRHPGVGVVREDERMLRRLRKLAAGRRFVGSVGVRKP